MHRKKRCHWRETSYMLSELVRVINPGVGLKKTVENWGGISKFIEELPRKRMRFLEQAQFLCQY